MGQLRMKLVAQSGVVFCQTCSMRPLLYWLGSLSLVEGRQGCQPARRVSVGWVEKGKAVSVGDVGSLLWVSSGAFLVLVPVPWVHEGNWSTTTRTISITMQEKILCTYSDICLLIRFIFC